MLSVVSVLLLVSSRVCGSGVCDGQRSGAQETFKSGEDQTISKSPDSKIRFPDIRSPL